MSAIDLNKITDKLLERAKSALIIDDSDDYRSSMKDYLESEGFSVSEARSPEEAALLLKDDSYQIVLAEALHRKSGFEPTFYAGYLVFVQNVIDRPKLRV